VAAAAEDPRFPPVSPMELPSLRVEISVLTPLVPSARRGRDRQARADGLAGEDAGAAAAAGPVEWGWDRETFLDQTCVKAGLPPSAWRHGATLRAFTADVFGEEGKPAT